MRLAFQDHTERFMELFGQEPELLVEAPGRVNLLGGHVDYNEGFVLPVAIDRKVLFLSRRRQEERIKIHSTKLSRSVTIRTGDHETSEGWTRYLTGILHETSRKGLPAGGLDLLIDGDLPMGSGLGSSAALEVGFLITLIHQNGFELSEREVIETCHRVENTFVGMNCGIMDQFASMMGKQGSAILLDCRKMSCEYIPYDDAEISLLLFDSGVRRELIRSDYNDRRIECSRAVEEIKLRRPEVHALRDIQPNDLAGLETHLSSTSLMRCRHVVTEIDRVLSASEALRSKDTKRLGELLNSSHISLRDDFEVSCAELDLLFLAARKQKGVYGARLTGAGFGGSLLVLCRPTEVDRVIDGVSVSFRDRFGTSPEATICHSSDGAIARWL